MPAPSVLVVEASAKAPTSEGKVGLEAGADDDITNPLEPLDRDERPNALASR